MRFPWRLLLLLLISTVVGLVSYDVYSSGSFKASRTSRWLGETGILVFLEQVYARIRLYGGKSVAWLEEAVPYYYARACEIVGPYLRLAADKIYEFAVYVATVTAPQRAWLAKNIPLAIEWAHSKVPWLWAAITRYANITWEFIVFYSLFVWKHIVHYTHITGTWLQENVFVGQLSPENIHKTLSSSLAVVQSYSSAALQWCVQMWNGNKTN